METMAARDMDSLATEASLAPVTTERRVRTNLETSLPKPCKFLNLERITLTSPSLPHFFSFLDGISGSSARVGLCLSCREITFV